VLLAHFNRDAGPGQPHELSERRIRAARATGQRWNKARHGRVAVTVKRTQIDRVDSPASWAITCGNCGADRRREKSWHTLGVALVPDVD
jgi:hypothetical protein